MATKKMELKKIGVVSAGKVMALLYIAFGLLYWLMMAPILALVSLSGDAAATVFAWLFGLAGLILMPLIFGVMGFVLGVFFAWVYNIIANKFGGLEMHFG